MTPPARIGRYEIVGLLAQGGMGAVYKARDPSLDRIVALKTVHAHLLGDETLREEFLERFRREARAAARLAHPHIVAVHDFGFDEATATPFIVMEYVEGASLETVLRETAQLPVAQAVGMIEQVASALEEAHARGVVHRDIKAANVFVDVRGRVKVGDFGVARIDDSELTQAGVSLGTPGYTAPEVVRGETATPASDVFSLGVLAYRLLTGKKPFFGATRESLALDLLEREPTPIPALRPEVPEPVAAAVARALVKSAGDRPADGGAFLRELRGAGATVSVVASPPPAVPAAPAVETAAGTTIVVPTAAGAVPGAPRRSDRAWIVAAVLAVTALGLLAAYLSARPSRERPGSTTIDTAPSPRAPVPARTEPRGERTSGPRAVPSPARTGTPDGPVDAVASEARRKLEELSRDALKKAEERAREELKRPRGRDKKEPGKPKKDKGR